MAGVRTRSLSRSLGALFSADTYTHTRTNGNRAAGPAPRRRRRRWRGGAARAYLELLLHFGELALDGALLTLVGLGGGGAAAALWCGERAGGGGGGGGRRSGQASYGAAGPAGTTRHDTLAETRDTVARRDKQPTGQPETVSGGRRAGQDRRRRKISALSNSM